MVVEPDSLSAPATSTEFATWVRPHLLVMRRLAARLVPAQSWLLAVTADQASERVGAAHACRSVCL